MNRKHCAHKINEEGIEIRLGGKYANWVEKASGRGRLQKYKNDMGATIKK